MHVNIIEIVFSLVNLSFVSLIHRPLGHEHRRVEEKFFLPTLQILVLQLPIYVTLDSFSFFNSLCASFSSSK